MSWLRTKLRAHMAALVLGTAVTCGFSVSSVLFYASSAEERGDSLWYLLLDTVHTKSIDLRMRLRGTRQPQTPLAVVGIDERSLQAEGRWPWSRDKIARIIDELFKHGARVIATDIMFSETSNDEIKAVLRGIPEDSGSSAYARAIKEFKERQLRLSDADARLARTIREHRDRLVLSATYHHLEISYQPYQSALCYEYIYRGTPYYRAWENEGYDIETRLRASEGGAAAEFPEEFTERTESLEAFFDEIFLNLAERTSEDFCRRRFSRKGSDFKSVENCRAGLTPKERDEEAFAIAMAKREYCFRWLKKGEDEYYDQWQAAWPQILESEDVYLGKNLSFEDFVRGVRTRGGLTTAFFPADFWVNSIPLIDEATRYTGFLNAHPDSDGTIRKAPLIVRSGDQLMPSLAFRTALVALGAQKARVTTQKSRNNEYQLDVTDLEILKDNEPLFAVPVDEQARFYINYAGPGYTFPHISAKELLEPDNPNLAVTYRAQDGGKSVVKKDAPVKKADFLKGKTVIIGGTAIGIYDLRVTPFDENFRGVETHINIIDNILRKDFLSQSKDEPFLMLVALLALGLGMTVAISFLGATWGLAFSILVTAAVWFVDQRLLFGRGIVVAVFFPIGITVSVYFGLTIFKYFTEEKKKRQIRGTFEKYVSPAIVNEVMSHPDKIRLGGRKEHMTVFFSDVRGFTTISETLDPEALSNLLNMYLTPMTALVFKNNGTLDKYMGDAIMAFFGAPLPSATHADDACRCALQNIEQLHELNRQLKEKRLNTIDVGIGINTGLMSVGNMGSETVRNYTVMGDAVNLGSRLEGINKQYGTRIIISEFTERELSAGFLRREIDWVRVKGKEQPVRIFELMGEGDLAGGPARLAKKFASGFALYHRMNWAGARAEFQACLEIVADDPVSKLYVERCNEYLADPPGADWDGVFVMKSK